MSHADIDQAEANVVRRSVAAQDAFDDMSPQSTVPVEPLRDAVRKVDLDNFNQWAARWMRRRLDDGERKFGPQSWRDNDYTDNQNAARLVRAVEHLFVVLRHWRDPNEAQFTDATELGKRAADVANQAFMLADQQRQEGDEPFTFVLDAARASQPVTATAREAIAHIRGIASGEGGDEASRLDPHNALTTIVIVCDDALAALTNGSRPR